MAVQKHMPTTIWKAPKLKITRVKQIDNLDQGDMFGANRADFYALVWINGKKTQTKTLAKDDGKPNWVIPLDMTERRNKITIRLMDDDGGFERHDDHADISPKPHHKDLTFTYDRFTGWVSGGIDGQFGQTLVSQGYGDDDIAHIEFMIFK